MCSHSAIVRVPLRHLTAAALQRQAMLDLSASPSPGQLQVVEPQSNFKISAIDAYFYKFPIANLWLDGAITKIVFTLSND